MITPRAAEPAPQATPAKATEDYHALEDSGSRSAQSPLGTPSPRAQSSTHVLSPKQVAASTPGPIALAATPGSATASSATASRMHAGAGVPDTPPPTAAAATSGGAGVAGAGLQLESGNAQDLCHSSQNQRMSEMESRVSDRLDRFFGDDRLWQLVAKEVSGNGAKFSSSMDMLLTNNSSVYTFRVQVPKPYPGVQYRKSKCLDDRYPRYAKHGSTVTGQVEDNGEWLRISGKVFLPMKVGNISIMEPLSKEAAAKHRESKDDQAGRWWACGPGGQDEEASATKETSEGMNQNQQLPWEDAAENQSSPMVPAGARDPADVARETRDGFTGSEEAALRAAALKALPEAARSQVNNLDAANRIFSDPINPFSDTPRGGSPSESPLRSRPVSIQA